MDMKPTKLTFMGGKPVLVSYDERIRKDTDKAYNYYRKINDNEYMKFYHSTEWKHKRQEILERDYIIPSKDDWSDRLNADNLQSLCRPCHRIKTKREWMKHHKGMTRYMDINIVCGLPGSGKTTYVKHHMTERDLIYDYDSLMQSLSGLPMQQSNHDIHDYIMLFFDQMLRKLKAEKTFNNVWIIRTLPDKRIDTLLSNYHHINHILVDTEPIVCKRRLEARKQTISFQKILNDFRAANFAGYRVVKNR